MLLRLLVGLVFVLLFFIQFVFVVEIFYSCDVQLIFIVKCVVCYVCYDLFCQFNLSSVEGVQCGVN